MGAAVNYYALAFSMTRGISTANVRDAQSARLRRLISPDEQATLVPYFTRNRFYSNIILTEV